LIARRLMGFASLYPSYGRTDVAPDLRRVSRIQPT
jgi:hypothetical protein